MKNNTSSVHHAGFFGAASLLVIFAVLCLTLLALLTLEQVRNGTESSVRAAEQTAAYYEAESRAHEILAALREGKIPDEVTRDGDAYTYTCPISDTQALKITVVMDASHGYTVLEWRRISVFDWQADASTDVWDGNIPDGDET